jgi:hypothetical protein
MVTLDGGINIKAGAETYVGFTRKYTYKEPAPYSDCIEHLKPFSAYSRKLFGYFADMNIGQYNQSTCLKLCYQDKLIQSCNCASTIVNTVRNARYCQTNIENLCEYSFKHNFSMVSTDEYCENVCRIECKRQTFQLTNSLASYPTDIYTMFSLQIFLANQNPLKLVQTDAIFNLNSVQFLRYVDMSMLRVVVNYDDLLYTAITESPAISSDQLIGSIGGHFGLFIGMSLLTFLELFELGALIAMTAIKFKCKQRPERIANQNAVHSFENNGKKQHDKQTANTDCFIYEL